MYDHARNGGWLTNGRITRIHNHDSKKSKKTKNRMVGWTIQIFFDNSADYHKMFWIGWIDNQCLQLWFVRICDMPRVSHFHVGESIWYIEKRYM